MHDLVIIFGFFGILLVISLVVLVALDRHFSKPYEEPLRSVRPDMARKGQKETKKYKAAKESKED